MDKAVAVWLGWVLPEPVLFFIKSGMLLLLSGTILWIALAAHYPAVHDTMHNVRHALAVVPCH
ncbi:MAG: CbtB domain-containing protein [Candidatus Binatia bacterium]